MCLKIRPGFYLRNKAEKYWLSTCALAAFKCVWRIRRHTEWMLPIYSFGNN